MLRWQIVCIVASKFEQVTARFEEVTARSEEVTVRSEVTARCE